MGMSFDVTKAMCAVDMMKAWKRVIGVRSQQADAAEAFGPADR